MGSASARRDRARALGGKGRTQGRGQPLRRLWLRGPPWQRAVDGWQGCLPSPPLCATGGGRKSEPAHGGRGNNGRPPSWAWRCGIPGGVHLEDSTGVVSHTVHFVIGCIPQRCGMEAPIPRSRRRLAGQRLRFQSPARGVHAAQADWWSRMQRSCGRVGASFAKRVFNFGTRRRRRGLYKPPGGPCIVCSRKGHGGGPEGCLGGPSLLTFVSTAQQVYASLLPPRYAREAWGRDASVALLVLLQPVFFFPTAARPLHRELRERLAAWRRRHFPVA